MITLASGSPNWRRLMALCLATLMMATGPLMARADMISTGSELADARQLEQRTRLLTALEQEEVRDALVARGVDPEQAAERIARLSEQEMAMFADQMDELPAGAGAVTLLLVIILLILLLR